MKINIHKYRFLAVLIVGLITSPIIVAQEFDIKKYREYYKFKTVKQADNSRLLEVSYIVQNKKDRKDKIPVFEAEINFYNTLEDSEILLGTARTGEDGIAKLIVDTSQEYLTDEDGYINISAKFKGTKTLKKKSKSVAFKDLQLKMDLVEIDSVKTVKITAYTLDSINTKIPVEEADITIGVKSLLSNLVIEEGTIEGGEFEYEFPTDLPGDGDGDLTVVVNIEDNDDFGNLIQEKSVNWGVHKITPVKKVKNTLWSESAPLWMYIVLTILLVGVWANYIYTIVNLFRIKKEGIQLEATSDE